MSQFFVSARTLVHLGAELITSDPIALYELIKNSIDARSPSVTVKFNIKFSQEKIISLAEKWNGLDIEDWRRVVNNDLADLKESSLNHYQEEETEFSDIRRSKSPNEASEKLLQINTIEIIDSGEGMPKDIMESVFLTLGTACKLDRENDGHPYLGNKGIGRISMMRLGQCSEVISLKLGEVPHRIYFDWREFENPEKMLSDIQVHVQEIDYSSPLKTESGTYIKITHLRKNWSREGVKKDFVEKFLRRLRNPFDINPFNFPINVFFNGECEKSRISITPIDEQLWELSQRTLTLYFDPDDNSALKMSIKDSSDNDRILPFQTKKEFLSHTFDCDVSDLDKLGKFTFRLKWFNRAVLRSDLKNLGLSNRQAELRQELDLWSGGIAIYRDGFRVGYSGDFEDEDFFAIDHDALRGHGFTLNRIQIIAALEITKKENKFLLDRSNREGLIQNKQITLLSRIISDIALVQLRESINEDKRNENPVKIEKIIKNEIDSTETKIKSIRKGITKIQSGLSEEDKVIVREINEDLHSISNYIKNFENVAHNLIEQREDILELAGAGTMMHVIMHELARTTQQTKELLGQFSKSTDDNLKKIVKKLEREIKTINTRIRQFDPMSISGRHGNSSFDLIEMINTIISGYSGKVERHNIKIEFTVDDAAPSSKFIVRMVQGFISIALENLLSNSTYWLAQNSSFKGFVFSEEKLVKIDLDTTARTISIWDSGVGIARDDRERIFIPGYTTKKSSRDGKGFGLFIAREVTQYSKGSLFLEDSPDADGRLRRFVLELPKDKDTQ